MSNEQWIGTDVKGNGCGLFEVSFQHLPGRMERNHEKSKSGCLVSQLRFTNEA
jgi:hypothetical protein